MNESKWEVRKGTIWLGSFPNYDAAEFYRTKRYGNGKIGEGWKASGGISIYRVGNGSGAVREIRDQEKRAYDKLEQVERVLS